MPSYSEAAAWYDALYSGEKDYAAEADVLAALIRELRPTAKVILDVACGTGEHARHLGALGFEVRGIDIEPEFVAIASAKYPEGKFSVADMTTVALPQRFDAIVCLFSSIGYVRTVERLNQTLARLASHLLPGGVLIVDPWFEPEQLTDGGVRVLSVEADALAISRVHRTVISGAISVLEMEYVIGLPTGIQRRSERHHLGLFTQEQMESAFRAARLEVERRGDVLRKRGVYVGIAEHET